VPVLGFGKLIMGRLRWLFLSETNRAGVGVREPHVFFGKKKVSIFVFYNKSQIQKKSWTMTRWTAKPPLMPFRQCEPDQQGHNASGFPWQWT